MRFTSEARRSGIGHGYGTVQGLEPFYKHKEVVDHDQIGVDHGRFMNWNFELQYRPALSANSVVKNR